MLFSAAFLFILFSFCIAAHYQPSVKVSLATKSSEWKSPSFALEFINLIHEQADTSIFSLIAYLKENGMLKPETASKDFYSFCMDSNKELEEKYYANKEAKDLIKVSLASHAIAPRIQSFYHFYENSVPYLFNNTLDPSCKCWIDWGGIQVCKPEQVSRENISPDWKSPRELSFDISYKPSKSKKYYKTAVFYADIHAEEYMPLFNTLQAIADSRDDFNFILRFKPTESNQDRMYLSGYGVEMAVKNTEYKAVDDRNVQEVEGDATQQDQANEKYDNDVLNEEEPSIQHIAKEKMKSVALLAVSFALGTNDSFSSLVRVSTNFPKIAHLLKTNSLSSSVSRLGSQMIKTVTGGQQVFYLNGIPFDVERFNAFEILRIMKTENLYLSQLESFGMSLNKAFDLMSSSTLTTSSSFDWGDCFNTKSDLVLWINDIENDAMYRPFPKSIFSLLQQAYSNQVKYIRKNIFSSVFFIDFSNPAHLVEVTKIANIINQQAPLRFGVVPVLTEYSSIEEKMLAVAVNEIRKSDKDQLIPFVLKLMKLSREKVTLPWIKSTVSEITRKSLEHDHDEAVAEIIALNERLGISKNGAIFGNGNYLPLNSEWTQPLLSLYFKMASYLTQAVMTSRVTDKDDIYDHYMNLPNVYLRRHPAIFPDESRNLEMVSLATVNLGKLNWVYSDSVGAKIFSTSIIIYADLRNELDFIRQSLKALSQIENTRLAFIDTSEKDCNDLNAFILNNSSPEGVKKYLDEIEEKSNGCLHSESLKSLFALPTNSKGCFINGRKVSLEKYRFTKDDFVTLVSYEFSKRIEPYFEPIIDAFIDQNLEKMELEDKILHVISIVTNSQANLEQSGNPTERNSLKAFKNFEDSIIHVKVGDRETSKFRFTAAIQPISETGQKILSVLDKFRKISSVSIDLFAISQKLNKDTETLPLRRFYTFVFDHEPSFNAEGGLIPSRATFLKLPVSSLLTLGMDVPGSWLVRPKLSIYDLDNIKLSAVPQGRSLEADFGLESLLVEGHSSDKNTQMPPRGLQYILGTPKQEVVDESITMANLGYVQLKGAPGVWHLKIRPGRSSEVYNLDSIQSGTPEDSTVIVDSFEGVTLYPKVSKKPGMENADVLVDSEPSMAQNVWNNIKSSVFKSESQKVVNVFTVASGHLYERFMAIMMLSVKKQSKHPIKFWLIENFLSPNFLEFLPYLAKAFDFDFELVTYKWPHWLRKQTEKQRIIWGYKILFLDVLFPLSLEKVIFVDADQVVRTDLIELVNLDLKGAVYGYTPFCSSRKEMDGFRFWKGGYWENHLAGRPYHISALYVIDLVKFRAIAAGDRLRQQYHMLSADPNSLSNLDQDLPNNMIHEIPMFSLPQDWLWCETWCSDEGLKTAKTIDLCNNPLTKEPKLERAKRILPEWVGLDNEVAKVRKEFEERLLSQTFSSSSSKKSPADDGEEHNEL